LEDLLPEAVPRNLVTPRHRLDHMSHDEIPLG
jgi:hypothetical protein